MDADLGGFWRWPRRLFRWAGSMELWQDAAAVGYTVVLCFIGIFGPEISEQRVAMRVSQGGHDVPTEKLEKRYPRVQANLKAALLEIPHVWVFENDDLRSPYRLTAVYENGKPIQLHKPIPAWLAWAQEKS
jgi:predicted ABC-type ATPase